LTEKERKPEKHTSPNETACLPKLDLKTVKPILET